MKRGSRPRLTVTLGLIAINLFGVLIARAEAQDADRIVREQTTVIDRFEPPPKRPPSIAVTHIAPVGGLPVEQLGTVRVTLRNIDLEGAKALDPAVFSSLWKDLIGREISLADLKAVIDGSNASIGAYKDEPKLDVDGALFRFAVGARFQPC